MCVCLWVNNCRMLCVWFYSIVKERGAGGEVVGAIGRAVLPLLV